ncbi:hypothetical protein ACWC1D_28035, partial [Streptomyces sp. NPDC001478]
MSVRLVVHVVAGRPAPRGPLLGALLRLPALRAATAVPGVPRGALGPVRPGSLGGRGLGGRITIGTELKISVVTVQERARERLFTGVVT